MSLGLSLGLALGAAPIVAAPGANPNLLLWTDEFDNAVWTKTNTIVTADQPAPADEVSSTNANAALRQIGATAAATGSSVTAVASMPPSPTYQRFSVTGSFDGQAYVYSVELQDTGVAVTPEITLRLDRSGGFLRCSHEDAAGDGDYLARRAQLELGSSFTTYHHRGGS